MKSVPRRILVVHRKGGLGDLLLATSVPAALKVEWPQAEVSFLCSREGKPLMERCPEVKDVLAFDERFAGLLSRSRLLRTRRYDIALVLWSTAEDAWMSFLSSIPVRVGTASKLLYSFLYTHRVRVRSEAGDRDSHWIEILQDYVRALGIKVGPPRTSYRLEDADVQEAKQLLRSSGAAQGDTLVGFHLGKGITSSASRWPVEAFAGMGKAILQETGCRLILTGGAAEKPLAGRLKDALGTGAVDVSGQTSVARLGGVVSSCQAFVCPDSFPMHLAAALGTPVVGIFALKSDIVSRWRPWTESYRIVRPRDPGCERACVKETCRDFRCYEQVDPAAVAASVGQLLRERSGRPHRDNRRTP